MDTPLSAGPNVDELGYVAEERDDIVTSPSIRGIDTMIPIVRKAAGLVMMKFKLWYWAREKRHTQGA